MLSARSCMSEIQLAAAVIHRALEDAITPNERLAKPRIIQCAHGRRQVFTPGLKPRDREEAVRFLLDDGEGWTGAREAWCEQADLDPLTLRRRALQRIPIEHIPAELRARLLSMPAPAGMHRHPLPAAAFVASATPPSLEAA
ncbi:hypothetical protein [Roseomonas sp. HF4]|uniref:hypothetical protein n=1 Tax=Roseomonas sp. HF4 TaxID=2562313 RepID=UPI0010C0E0C7|nr:hypothetical protein [Roseomonas sp. HF4]